MHIAKEVKQSLMKKKDNNTVVEYYVISIAMKVSKMERNT